MTCLSGMTYPYIDYSVCRQVPVDPEGRHRRHGGSLDHGHLLSSTRQ